MRASVPVPQSASWPSSFVKVDDVPAALDGVVVLDTRDAKSFRHGHLAGATRVDWLKLRDGWLRTGRLDDDTARLARKLAATGVDDERRVLVVGAGRRGWGEEARIAWTLVYLGHARTAILDGGVDAWTGAGRALTVDVARPRPGTFTPRPVPALRATKGDVAAASGSGVQIVDARTGAEVDGARRYFEARGGHVPGAAHLEWSALLDDAGRLRSKDDVVALLIGAGVDPARPVVAYCTGGVRSAMVVMALRAHGLVAANYDGGFWEWSADPRMPVAR